jgi:hypothetical protein
MALQFVEALPVLLTAELAPRIALREDLTRAIEGIGAAVAPPDDQPHGGADQGRPRRAAKAATRGAPSRRCGG